jgi:hypothetical protein
VKITIFDRKKHIENYNNLVKRGAPRYVLEAYMLGYVSLVNTYYKIKLNLQKVKIESTNHLYEFAKTSNLHFVREALSQRDEEFLKAFFVLTNLDIVTGNRLNRAAGKLLKPGIAKSLGLKDLYKRNT